MYEEILQLGITKFTPLLESLKKDRNIGILNELLDYLSDFYLKYAQLLRSYIDVVQRCKQVSAQPAFMKHLEETMPILHDFVISMASTAENDNSVKFSNNFYIFFKIHRREIFGKMKNYDFRGAVTETKDYIRTIRSIFRSVKPIKRIVRKKLIRNYKELLKVTQRVKIQPTRVIDLVDYLPSNMIPVVELMDETINSGNNLS